MVALLQRIELKLTADAERCLMGWIAVLVPSFLVHALLVDFSLP